MGFSKLYNSFSHFFLVSELDVMFLSLCNITNNRISLKPTKDALEVMYTRKQPMEVLNKKNIYRNFTKFTGKHPHWSLFFNIVPEACNFTKKRLKHRCFPLNFVEFLWTPFLQNTSPWLLLYVLHSFRKYWIIGGFFTHNERKKIVNYVKFDTLSKSKSKPSVES